MVIYFGKLCIWLIINNIRRKKMNYYSSYTTHQFNTGIISTVKMIQM
jgi:hypothetical protein